MTVLVTAGYGEEQDGRVGKQGANASEEKWMRGKPHRPRFMYNLHYQANASTLSPFLGKIQRAENLVFVEACFTKTTQPKEYRCCRAKVALIRITLHMLKVICPFLIKLCGSVTTQEEINL